MKKALLIGLAFSFIDAALGAQSSRRRRRCIERERTYVFLVRGGAKSMQVGGELVNQTTNGADVNGTAIRGGQVLKVAPGDMITIPPNVPHVWLIDPGQFVQYSLLRSGRVRARSRAEVGFERGSTSIRTHS